MPLGKDFVVLNGVVSRRLQIGVESAYLFAYAFPACILLITRLSLMVLSHCEECDLVGWYLSYDADASVERFTDVITV